MTAHTHGSSAASALVIPFVPRTEADATAVEAGTESFITALTTAVSQLEKALELSRTPAQFLLPNGATVTAAQLRLWVAQHTARAQTLLDRIASPYTDPQT
ncbi:hypothetical protein [Streptomyces europaeiscabiei]|uniref:hypothetical protein n=1 Tax=Streptomyces europaeiscabiei TaxID=146819 RepID=UPI0029B08CDC|nr:hypothetical protein [Streptomyces europaeiscabiei]MDX2762543.1 hypothetical protein [Streptomyces europaeiscabiei]